MDRRKGKKKRFGTKIGQGEYLRDIQLVLSVKLKVGRKTGKKVVKRRLPKADFTRGVDSFIR